VIEQRAFVVTVEQGYAWVETQRQTACGACHINKGCGTAVLAKVLGNRRSRVRAVNAIELREGDQVLIGIEEGALVKGSLAVYIAPLLGMILGAVGGDLAGGSEGLSILLGILGLTGGFAWLWSYTHGIRTDGQFQPVVLRRLTY